MNITETGMVLTNIKAIDNRNLGDTPQAKQDMILLWHGLIGELDYRDAVKAVVRHFQTSTEWLKPAHIHDGVAAIRRDRFNACGGEKTIIAILSFRDIPDKDYPAAKYALTQDILAGRRVAIPKELAADPGMKELEA